MRRLRGATALLAFGALSLPTSALAHLERPTTFPDPTRGNVPRHRTAGQSLVVCKPDSRRRFERNLRGTAQRENLRLLARCGYRHIQAAVDAAENGMRILVLPGVYREEPSRRRPVFD
ncbi:MAG: hypothetical protein WAQ33_12985, partial [Gaiellaceae bacterium]